MLTEASARGRQALREAEPLSQAQSTRRASFSRAELDACGRGELFGGQRLLPPPPLLLIDRITNIAESGGGLGKGQIRAEIAVTPELRASRAPGDPILSSAQLLDAFWQLLGFYLGWIGGAGVPRPISAGEIRVLGFVMASARLVDVVVDVTMVKKARVITGTADGVALVDGAIIQRVRKLRVGLFGGGARAAG